jgi:F-type H+/Na+-transporting ATPase subunit alpha
MFSNDVFNRLIADGHPAGEVVSTNRYLVTIKGLQGTPVGASVLFENGDRGIVREVYEGSVLLLNCDSETTPIGAVVVLENTVFSVSVGSQLIGRVVDAFGRPLDGKGVIELDASRPVFSSAPGIAERSLLKDQLHSGVTMIDMMFPIVLGQRIAILGDTKSGKTSFLLQVGANQAKSDRVMVYVLIGKRQSEIDQLVNTLTQTGMIEQSIIVVADIFHSLAQSYIAPYAGCAMAEHLWYEGRDVVIVYDDLSSHAKVYREISLLSEVNPGRDSYPGDMFFAHSSLLERAGKLKSNDKTLTALPVVTTPGDDITAYLPTSIMSITDGQLIFDLTTFRQSIRPALNVGLSVSRVGGRAQTARQKELTGSVLKTLAEFRQAQEFSHFGSDMSDESRQLIQLGLQLQEAFRQLPSELYAIAEQELLLRAITVGAGKYVIDVPRLKKLVRGSKRSTLDPKEYDKLAKEVLAKVVVKGES